MENETEKIIQSLSQQLQELTIDSLERMKMVSRVSKQLATKESEVLMLMSRLNQAEQQIQRLTQQIQDMSSVPIPSDSSEASSGTNTRARKSTEKKS